MDRNFIKALDEYERKLFNPFDNVLFNEEIDEPTETEDYILREKGFDILWMII